MHRFFVWLGFFTGFNRIFIKDLKSMLWSFITITLFVAIISSISLCYTKRTGKNCLIFNIFIYVPCIIIYFYLLSEFVENKYILAILSIIISDFLALIIFVLIFRCYKGYGFLFFSAILNVISMIIFYHSIFYIKGNKEITIISITVSLIFLFMIIFNSIVRKKLEDDEKIATVYFFDYCIFFPVFIIIICGILLALALVGLSIMLAIVLACLAILLALFLACIAIGIVGFILWLFFESLK